MPKASLPFGGKPPSRGDAQARRVWQVSAALNAANSALEGRFGNLWVEGEVSDLKRAGSGHVYFTLKDARSAMAVVIFRTDLGRLRFRLREGAQIRVHGRMGIFSGQGRFQFYCDRAEPVGEGELMVAFEELKRRLHEEGLFDRQHKQPLPRWPKRIGVVTSADGAAIHDILTVLAQRRPSHVLLAPAPVQGPAAAPELVLALRRVAQQDVDLIIIGRGGGSLEDLFAFNNEGLVRAVASCEVPIISAVGHEVDVSLCDLAADVRAATPSHAAELAVPDAMAVGARLEALERRLEGSTKRMLLDQSLRLDALSRSLSLGGQRLVAQQRTRLERASTRASDRMRALVSERRSALGALERGLVASHPKTQLAGDRSRLERATQRLDAAGRHLLDRRNARLATLAARLDALSPLKVLGRGYAVVTQEVEGQTRLVVDAEALEVGREVTARFARGRASLRVESTEAEE